MNHGTGHAKTVEQCIVSEGERTGDTRDIKGNRQSGAPSWCQPECFAQAAPYMGIGGRATKTRSTCPKSTAAPGERRSERSGTSRKRTGRDDFRLVKLKPGGGNFPGGGPPKHA